MRVLHVVENLDNQAVERWLLRMLCASRDGYSQFHWTFFCVLGKRGRLDDVARSLGAEVIHSKHGIGEKFRFMRSLREVMKLGRYHILHCHHDVMSAAYLLASQGLPFQKRIVHVHNTSLSLPTPSSHKAALLREPMRQLCLAMADEIVGVSRDALESLTGVEAFNPRRHRVIHCGVDTEQFSKAKTDRDAFRADLEWDLDARILLFVGRLVVEKNPLFLLELLEHLVKTNKNAVALFAGSGDQAKELRELAKRKCLIDRVKLVGFRDDVANLMVNSDILIWPSRDETKEGLGLGVVEAQAAGLPVLMSQGVPDEATVVPQLLNVMPVSAGAEAWARKVSEILGRPPIDRNLALGEVESSSFSLKAGVREIFSLYSQARTSTLRS